MKHDIRTLEMDVQIAVLAADGAVAVEDLVGVERWGEDFVFYGAAVAVGFVPDFLVGVGHGVLLCMISVN